jgi:hypothetical protein
MRWMCNALRPANLCQLAVWGQRATSQASRKDVVASRTHNLDRIPISARCALLLPSLVRPASPCPPWPSTPPAVNVAALQRPPVPLCRHAPRPRHRPPPIAHRPARPVEKVARYLPQAGRLCLSMTAQRTRRLPLPPPPHTCWNPASRLRAHPYCPTAHASLHPSSLHRRVPRKKEEPRKRLASSSLRRPAARPLWILRDRAGGIGGSLMPPTLPRRGPGICGETTAPTTRSAP